MAPLNTLRLIDSHCHLDFIKSLSISDAIENAKSLGVGCIIVPGVFPEQWAQLALLRATHSDVRIALGVHPWWLKQCDLVSLLDNLHHAVDLYRPVAIGECGLDRRLKIPIAEQLAFLELQLSVAKQKQLPVILHCVQEHSALLAAIKRFPNPCGGVIHAFSGSYDIAQAYWQQQYYIGVGGTITYERANKTRQAIAKMPLESLLLETDSPDMPLCGKQGQENLPEYVMEVAKVLAELKGISLDDVIAVTTQNAYKLFKL